jgi:hypothetical protein
MPRVDFIRPDIKCMFPIYDTVRDCIAGEQQIKHRRTKYLPMPNPEDTSKDNQTRYTSYLTRAVFYNVTKRTLGGLSGQVFMREPQIEVPTLLDMVKEDASGAGVSAEQLAKRAANLVIAHGRAGVLTDYPVTEGPASKAQLEAGDIRPTMTVYEPWAIINWRTFRRGGRDLLSLVVLQEQYVISDDGFEVKFDTQWRVLRLVGGNVYTVEIWRKTGGVHAVHEGPFVPKGADGLPLNEIPFMFMGSENNDDQVDNPPLYDMASLNIAHYRNSADYEESAYMCGQPTPWFAGLTQEWVTNVMKGVVALGSRSAIMLPPQGTAGLLQPDPNTMPKEAMEHKERQMVALGAKLVEEKSVQRTATEADLENASESSTLATSAKNVSTAMEFAFKWAARFIGAPDTEITFKLNTEFDLTKMSPEERKALIAEWQAGAIAWPEMRENMRRAGIAKLDDDEAKALIDAELAKAPNLDPNNRNNPNQPPRQPGAGAGA